MLGLTDLEDLITVESLSSEQREKSDAASD